MAKSLTCVRCSILSFASLIREAWVSGGAFVLFYTGIEEVLPGVELGPPGVDD